MLSAEKAARVIKQQSGYAKSPEEAVTDQQPKKIQRLRAVSGTIIHNPRHITDSIRRGAVAAAGSEIGYLFSSEIHPGHDVYPVPAGVILGLVSASILSIAEFFSRAIPRNRSFNKTVANAEKGAQIKFNNPGSLHEAWSTGQVQRKEQLVLTTPGGQIGKERKHPIEGSDIVYHNILARTKGKFLSGEGCGYRVEIQGVYNRLLIVEFFEDTLITTIRPKDPSPSGGKKIFPYTQVLSCLDPNSVKFSLCEGSVIQNPNEKRPPYIASSREHNKIVDLTTTGDPYAFKIFDGHIAALRNARPEDRVKLKTYTLM